MREDRLERICEMVRSLKEEGGPTMAVGAGGYTGSADSKGPVAGYDPVLGKVDRRNKNRPELFVYLKKEQWGSSVIKDIIQTYKMI